MTNFAVQGRVFGLRSEKRVVSMNKEQIMNQIKRDTSSWTTTLIFGAAAVLAVACANIAYACPAGGEGGMRHMQRMADDLKLSDQQRQQFKQIHSEGHASGKALHDVLQANRKAMRKLDPGSADYHAQVVKLAAEKGELVKQMVIQHAEMRAKVYAILTPEQRKMAKEMKEKHPRHEKGKSDHR